MDCLLWKLQTNEAHTSPSPASLLPLSSQPSLQPCLTVRHQREMKTSHHKGGEGRGSQIHRAISYSDAQSCQPAHPLIWQLSRQLQSHSSFRLMRCQKTPPPAAEEQTLPQTHAASPAALAANDLSCCCVTPTTPEKGRVLSEPPEGAFRYISNDCWLQ